jgi:hypothetical protein
MTARAENDPAIELGGLTKRFGRTLAAGSPLRRPMARRLVERIATLCRASGRRSLSGTGA